MSAPEFTAEQLQYLSTLQRSSKNGGRSRKIIPPSTTQTKAVEPQFDPTQGINEIIAAMTKGIEEYRAQMQAEQDAALKKYEEEQARMVGVNDLNTAFTERLSAAQKAMQIVDFQLKNEELHAKSRGLDIGVTEQDKTARYNTEFSKLWSAEQDQRFNELQQKWGSETTQWLLPVTRTEQAAQQSSIMTPIKVGDKLDKDTLLTRKGTVLGG